MKWIVCILLMAALLIVACTPAPPSGFTPGLVANADLGSADAGNKVGAKVMRVEFDIGASTSSMAGAYSYYAARGISILPLAGFAGRIPTVTEAQNLGNWCRVYGPNGTFWSNRNDGHLASQFIEFGNETSYGYQYGDDYASQTYKDRAKNYALRFKTARQATPSSCGLLAQAEDGGSGSPNWVDNMYLAVPELSSLVSGWTVHPYGPRSRWEGKIDRLIQFTAAHGASNSIPIDVTEYGISSDNGRTLNGNYDWPPNLTYDQAAWNLGTTINDMRSKYGSRLRYFFIYCAHDLRAPGTSSEREHYFGVVKQDLTDKGAYTSYVRNLYSQATQKAIAEATQ